MSSHNLPGHYKTNSSPEKKRQKRDHAHETEKNPVLVIMASAGLQLDMPPSSSDVTNHNSELSSCQLLIPDHFEYDVFINFQGEDTRKCFVGHLHNALKQQGVRSYLDFVELNNGESMDNLFSVIERSAVFIPIFSKQYAESRLCLKEIKKIVDCKRRTLPIFFDVEPSDVRHQIGAFAQDFAKHQSIEKVEILNQWREALSVTATFSGYVLEKDYQGGGAKLINDVLEEVLHEVYKVPFEVAEHPVGMDARLKKMTDLLQTDQTDEVRFIGICGVKGLGKSTIAKATFNKSSLNFEGCAFLANVRERAAKQGGLVQLQKDLVTDLFNDKDQYISDPSAGIQVIKRRVRGKKILIVLDDVDKMDQLHNLVGDGSGLHKGSRIIITTRDKGVLVGHGLLDHDIYTPDVLNKDQSLELFSHFAFKRHKPTEEFLQLAREIVDSIGSQQLLPLSIKLLGSHFSTIKTENWRLKLEKLKQVLQGEEVLNTTEIEF